MAILITILTVFILFQTKYMIRATVKFIHVRDSKDAVKRHFHKQELILCINLYIVSIAFAVGLILGNL